MVMMRSKHQPIHTTLLLLSLLLLVVLPSPSYQEEAISFYDWVRKNQSSPGQDVPCACAKKDATLSSAETSRVTNFIDPAIELRPEEGGYKTIGESIANIPEGNTKRYVLILKPGAVFREKLVLSRSKPFITLKCDDPKNPAVIVWNDTATTPGKDGKPLGADGGSTVTIESDYFVAYGVVFKNDAPLPKPAGAGGEAPALRVLGTKATFYNCTIDGGRGALYDQMGLHYFKDCAIKGTWDFIFGSAKSFYEACKIISLNKDDMAASLPMAPPEPQRYRNFIKATPGESGLCFKACTIEGEAGPPKIFFGRVGTPVIYTYTEIGKEIEAIISSDDGGAKRIEKGYYCATFKCGGPGMATMSTTTLTYAEAKPFLGTYYISGDSWIPSLPPAEE